MDSLMKGLMGSMPPQKFWARTAPDDRPVRLVGQRLDEDDEDVLTMSAVIVAVAAIKRRQRRQQRRLFRVLSNLTDPLRPTPFGFQKDYWTINT